MLAWPSQVATLEQQVANLERQRQQEASSLRASSEHMQQEMQGRCTNLQAQLDAFQVYLHSHFSWGHGAWHMSLGLAMMALYSDSFSFICISAVCCIQTLGCCLFCW